MKIHEIRNLTKKETPLHYRNEYSGSLVYSAGNIEKEAQLEFTLERTATGNIDISIAFPASIHYPLVPAVKKVKSYIFDLEKDGRLL
ncbi:hypothetical protein [Marispirochaeta sp.]|jgi:hypothetical protein|uniref:hypothetical protein n=1 Tax=Marispirochaeta sp. TaxID=2038653 RepID=UPI0029C7B9F3|nr:hypothetical protein [Marispirochaeta sp.]